MRLGEVRWSEVRDLDSQITWKICLKQDGKFFLFNKAKPRWFNINPNLKYWCNKSLKISLQYISEIMCTFKIYTANVNLTLHTASLKLQISQYVPLHNTHFTLKTESSTLQTAHKYKTFTWKCCSPWINFHWKPQNLPFSVYSTAHCAKTLKQTKFAFFKNCPRFSNPAAHCNFQVQTACRKL